MTAQVTVTDAGNGIGTTKNYLDYTNESMAGNGQMNLITDWYAVAILTLERKVLVANYPDKVSLVILKK